MSRKNKNIALAFFLMFVIFLFMYIESRWNKDRLYERIAVEVYSSSMIVPITIEGKTYNFHLDTGAPTSISKELYLELCLNTMDSSFSHDYYGNTEWVKNTILPEIQIGQATFKNIDAGVINPLQNFLDCDKQIDGYLGSNFFHDKILMMNLSEKEVIITNDRSKLPIKRKDAITLELFGKQLAPLLIIEFPGKNSKESVLFDTGSSSHFYRPAKDVYHQMFMHGLFSSEDIFDTLSLNTGRGLFGPQKDSINFRVKYDTIRIGKVNFSNYVASTFESNFKSVLGAQLLSKGIVVVDWKYRHFYFTPYSSASLDFAPSLGFVLAYRTGKWFAHAVKHESSAYAHNIRDGFELKRLNDIQFNMLTDCDRVNFDWGNERSKQEVSYLFEYEGQEYCFNESKNNIGK